MLSVLYYFGANLHVLMKNEVEHLYMCLLAIYIFIFVKCLFKFCQLKIFIDLRCMSFLYFLVSWDFDLVMGINQIATMVTSLLPRGGRL